MRGATVIENLQEAVDDVSIHAPHAGRDEDSSRTIPRNFEFQSTRPMRGATEGERRVGLHIKFQSTRPMRGATCRQFRQDEIRVSIHAPHAGRDFSYLVCAIV